MPLPPLRIFFVRLYFRRRHKFTPLPHAIRQLQL